jgi:hypothetical protein
MAKPSSTPASAFGAHLVTQLDLPYRMILALAKDFTDEEARQAAGGNKPLVWYLGHTTITKDSVLSLYTGSESALSEEYRGRFGRGSDGSADFGDAPAKEELLATFKDVHGRLREFLSSLEPEDMSRPAGREAFHPLLSTLGSAVALVVAHDGYHAGQIAVLRRAMGKDPLFG